MNTPVAYHYLKLSWVIGQCVCAVLQSKLRDWNLRAFGVDKPQAQCAKALLQCLNLGTMALALRRQSGVGKASMLLEQILELVIRLRGGERTGTKPRSIGGILILQLRASEMRIACEQQKLSTRPMVRELTTTW
jgi:hypothetical protein